MKVSKRDYNSNYGPLVIHNKKDSIKNEEACAIRMRHPTKIPAIVDRYEREYALPYLSKRKFLVPEEITMCQFQSLIRSRLKVSPNKAIFLLVNNRSMVPLSKTLSEIYYEYRSDDGFLYITYSSQEVFG